MPPSPLITINKQLDFHTQSTKSRSFSNYSTKSYHRTPLAPPPPKQLNSPCQPPLTRQLIDRL